VVGFLVLLLSTTTKLIITPKAALGSSVAGAVSLCYCSVVCWLATLLDPTHSSIARLPSPTVDCWLLVGCSISSVASGLHQPNKLML
jgi:hypothetical protein